MARVLAWSVLPVVTDDNRTAKERAEAMAELEAARERMLAIQMHAIRTIGYTTLKPPGITKTMQQIEDEAASEPPADMHSDFDADMAEAAEPAEQQLPNEAASPEPQPPAAAQRVHTPQTQVAHGDQTFDSRMAGSSDLSAGHLAGSIEGQSILDSSFARIDASFSRIDASFARIESMDASLDGYNEPSFRVPDDRHVTELEAAVADYSWHTVDTQDHDSDPRNDHHIDHHINHHIDHYIDHDQHEYNDEYNDEAYEQQGFMPNSDPPDFEPRVSLGPSRSSGRTGRTSLGRSGRTSIGRTSIGRTSIGRTSLPRTSSGNRTSTGRSLDDSVGYF